MAGIEKVKMTRAVKSKKVKDKICEVTMQLVKKYGYEYITVDNICKSANVSVGSFYHYFKSKEELLDQYLSSAYLQSIDDIKASNSKDVMYNIVNIWNKFTAYWIGLGVDFNKNYWTTKNDRIDVRVKSLAMDLNSPTSMLKKTMQLIDDGKKNEYIKGDIDTLDYSLAICTINRACIFDWCVSDGNIDLLELNEKMIRTYCYNILSQKYLTEFNANAW